MADDFTTSVGRWAVTDALPWLLERPQQALFQGSRAGADASSAYDTAMQNAGVPAGLSNQAAQVLSIAPMLYGAVKGLTGIGDKVSGENLTQDFTGSPEWDRAIGNQLNVTADPLALIPASMAGKTADQMAGTAKRTWESLRGAQKIQPENVAKLDSKLGNWWYKYGLDVPASPQSALEPLAIRSERPGALANRMGYKSSGLPINEDATRGFSLPDVNAIAYRPSTQETTLPHELRHWARKVLPEELKPVANTVYDWIADTYSKTGDALRKIPSYSKKSKTSIGDEIFARQGPNIIQDWGNVGNILGRLQDTAQGAIQPQMYQNANPYAVSTLPFLGALADSLWDNR